MLEASSPRFIASVISANDPLNNLFMFIIVHSDAPDYLLDAPIIA
jgi:hypothetical protein